MSFKIRRALASDLGAILQLYASARAFMAKNGNPTQWGDTYPEQFRLEQDLENGTLYVCETGDGVPAAVFVYTEMPDPTYAVIREGKWKNALPYGVVHRIASSERAKGTGAASACLDWAFLQCGNVRIDTHENNRPMQALLLKKGYERCGKIDTDDGTERIAFQKTVNVILASASPRRKELMRLLHVPFVCEPAVHAEEKPAVDSPKTLAETLAIRKASEIAALHSGEDVTIIGSDTIVVCGGEVYGKPQDRADAARMLQNLSGRTHEVRTGVCLIRGTRMHSFTSVTRVRFYPLTETEIARYIDSGEPMDKAGAYGIQGQGALLVESIDGDYPTVVGLPIAKLARCLTGPDLSHDVS